MQAEQKCQCKKLSQLNKVQGRQKKVEQSLRGAKKLKIENWTKFFVVICRICRIYVGYVGYGMKQTN